MIHAGWVLSRGRLSARDCRCMLGPHTALEPGPARPTHFAMGFRTCSGVVWKQQETGFLLDSSPPSSVTPECISLCTPLPPTAPYPVETGQTLFP